jgi:hypothetical protein
LKATIPSPTLDVQGVRLTSVECAASNIEAIVQFEKLYLNATCIDGTKSSMHEICEQLLSEEGSKETTAILSFAFNYDALLLLDEICVDLSWLNKLNQQSASKVLHQSFLH